MTKPTCKVPGCTKNAKPGYRDPMCPMHRERLRLHGSTDDPRPKPMRYTDNGYWFIYQPGHPLAIKNGYVFEHRAVLYAQIGDGEHPCHWCGRLLRWDATFPWGIVVDHLDGSRDNNAPHNLVPSCGGCNSARPRREQTHCLRNHPLSGDNVAIHVDSSGTRRRRCRACARERMRRRRA